MIDRIESETPAKMPGMAPPVKEPKSPPTNKPIYPMRAKAITTSPLIFRALLTSFTGLPRFRVVRYFDKDDCLPTVVTEKETTSKPLPAISYPERSIRVAILLAEGLYPISNVSHMAPPLY